MPNSTRAFAAIAVLVAAALAVGACGYRFVEPLSATGADGGALRVAVRPLTNESFEPGIDALVTDALRREFLRRGGVRLVDDPGQADISVGGAISELETYATSVSSVSAALEQQIEVSADLHARRRDGSEVALSSTAFREWELYLMSADIEASRKNRDEALRRVASVIATRFHEVFSASLSP